MEVLVTANSGIKKGGIFMKNIIDNTIDKNIELYYAFFSIRFMYHLTKNIDY